MATILRPGAAWQRLGIKRSIFYTNYVARPGGSEFVPNTAVRRLRPVPLGKVAAGFIDDEIDAVINGLRAERDTRFAEGRQRSARRRSISSS